MLKLTEEKNIAFVSLNRPEVRNAFDPKLIAAITGEFKKLSGRHDLRAIVLSGEGKVFCAGADLNWMKDMIQYDLQKNQEDSHRLFEMFEAIWNCEVPVIGLAHGAAFGGALGLLAACDYVIADDKTQLCFSEVKLGISPAVISHFILKKCNLGVMTPLMISGKVFSPKEVLGSGLIHEVASEGHLAEAVSRAVQLFRETGPEAVRATKRLIKKMSDLEWPEAKKETAKVIADRRVSKEGQEGLKSFLEKRTPSWKM